MSQDKSDESNSYIKLSLRQFLGDKKDEMIDTGCTKHLFYKLHITRMRSVRPAESATKATHFHLQFLQDSYEGCFLPLLRTS